MRQERIGIHDHFLDLGGHSLLALSVIAYIRSRLGHHVPQAWLMKHPTVAELARQIESSGTTRVWPRQSAPWTVRNRCRCRSASNACGCCNRHCRTRPPTTCRWSIVCADPWIKPDYQHACELILARHEILRTALIQQDEALLQQVLPVESMAVPWQAVDWRQRTPTEQQHALQRRSAAAV